MDGAKIQLSEDEKRLISNGDWILTKNGILSKVNRLLTAVMQEQTSWLENNRQLFPGGIMAGSPKISRGENYLGLPWLMLDHPRLFTRQDTIAIRCFFWWGNFFSITLQLSGQPLQQYRARCAAAWPSLLERNYLLGVNDDPWIHHAGRDNYLALHEMDEQGFRDTINTHGFVKLMFIVPLNQWDTVPEKLMKEFRFLMALLAD